MFAALHNLHYCCNHF